MFTINKIHVLGIGPGSKEYLLPITKQFIKEADTLIGGERALELFKAEQKKELVIKADLARVRDYIKANYGQEQIAVLVSGDPGLYSLLNYLKRYFPKEELEVIPGISAMQLGFAKAKMSWQDAKLTSLHGQDNRAELIDLLTKHKKVGFFTDNKFPPHKIAQYLVEEGLASKQGVVAERLSYPQERIVQGSLKELSKQEFAALAVMMIYDE